MTIDDAIGHCDVTADVAEPHTYKQIAEKYREIGKWLRELKALKDGDMVSRQAVIDAYYESLETSECGTALNDEKFLKHISQLPSAEPKTGEWIYHDDDDMQYDTYHCSSCKKIFTVDAERFDDIGFVKEDLKYCPNCGSYNGGGVWEN